MFQSERSLIVIWIEIASHQNRPQASVEWYRTARTFWRAAHGPNTHPKYPVWTDLLLL